MKSDARVARTVTLTESPGSTAPTAQETRFWSLTSQLPTVVAATTPDRDGLTWSVTTTALAVEGPAFVTVMV